MFLVQYAKVTLEKNERFSTPLTIATWEVPVLMQAHGGRIEDHGRVTVKRKARPDATSEYQRLVNRYKHSDSSDVPYVGLVYGVGDMGVRKIEAEIQRSMAAATVAPATDISNDEAQEVSDREFVLGGAEESAEATA